MKFKKIYQSLAVASGLLAAASLSGCSNDDLPFEGSDNHFISLSLTTPEGIEFKASINGDEISVRVPENVSLDGASAEYSVCEQAKVLPEPHDISDWDSERVFRLISYNGSVRNYRYSVIREPQGSGESIYLSTQAELNAFAERKVSVIEGNLIIGSTGIEDDPVINTAPLASLKTVKGSVMILPSFNGNDLSGLKNLKTAGGIIIGTLDNAILTSTALNIDLPALTSTGDLILNCDNTKSLKMPSLKNASKIFVQSKQIEEIGLGSLENVTGNIEIGKNNADNFSIIRLEFPHLKTVAGNLSLLYMSEVKRLNLPELHSVSGYIMIDNLTALESLDLPELTEVGKALTLSLLKAKSIRIPKVTQLTALTVTSKKGNSIYDGDIETLDLASLRSVSGKFEISAKGVNMESLSLPSLESVGENFTINNLIALTKLELPRLKTVGTMAFTNFNALPSFSFPALAEVGALTLGSREASKIDMPAIKNAKSMTFTGFSNLTTLEIPASLGNELEGALTVTSCDNLKEIKSPSVIKGNVNVSTSRGAGAVLPRFSTTGGKIVSVEGDLRLTVYLKTVKIQGIAKIGGLLSFSGNMLTDIDFGDLRELGKFQMNYDSRVVSLKGSSLAKITDTFSILGMASLSTLSFPALKEVTSAFSISGNRYNLNGALTSLEGLANLEKAGTVEIKFCPELKDFSPLRKVVSTLTECQWKVSDNAYNPTLEDMKNGKYKE